MMAGQLAALLVVAATVAVPTPEPEGWRCRNTVEVHCNDGACEALPQDETTPLDVAFTTTGSFLVCAYTGCWDGEGKVLATESLLTIVKDDAPWSDPSNPDNAQDVAIMFDRGDSTAVVKAGGFVVPLACKPLPK